MTDMIEIPSASFIEKFKNITGAFSVAEGIALYNICVSSPDGLWVELGSHKGKSSSCIMLAVRESVSVDFIEPEFKDKWWRVTFLDTLLFTAHVEVSINVLDKYSLDYLSGLTESPSFVFVDSGVHDDMVMEEAKMLEDKMIPQGIIAFHDYKNQFTAVERAYNYLLSTGKYEVVSIDWPAILKYVTENNLEEGNNSWHQYPELGHPPNFVGALRRK